MHHIIERLEKFVETRYVNMQDINDNSGSEFEFKSSSVVKIGFLRFAFIPTYMTLEQ